MNLNALWNPVGVNGVLYSRLLPAQNQVGGNYDAFAYLGLALAALPVVVVSAAAYPGAVRRHGAVRGLRCADRVCREQRHHGQRRYAGHAAAARFFIKLSWSSPGGRLFWPVYYLLTLAAFAGLARLLRGAVCHTVCRRATVGCKPGAFPAARRHADRAGHGRVPVRAGQRFLAERGTVPPHRIVQGMQADSLHLALWAADNGMTTNDPFAARYDEAALCRRAPDRAGCSGRGHAAE